MQPQSKCLCADLEVSLFLHNSGFIFTGKEDEEGVVMLLLLIILLIIKINFINK